MFWKQSLTLAAIVCLSFVLSTSGADADSGTTAAEQDKGPETVTIDVNHSGKSVQKFPHRAHQDRVASKDGCKTCHHKTEAGAQPEKCSKCHTDPSEKDPATGAIGYKKAFHDRCVGCHKEQTEKPDLKKCKTCHG